LPKIFSSLTITKVVWGMGQLMMYTYISVRLGEREGKQKRESLQVYDLLRLASTGMTLICESTGGIPADVTVYIFAHLHRALRTEGNMLDIK